MSNRPFLLLLCGSLSLLAAQLAAHSQPSSNVPKENPVTSSTARFHVAHADDLQQPLQVAFAAASLGPSFTVSIAPGSYKSKMAVSLKQQDTSTLDLVIEGEGPAPTILEGLTFDIAARSVTLRNFILTDAQSPASILNIQASTAVVFDRIALAQNTRHDAQSRDPLVQVRALPGRSPLSITVRDSWFALNTVAGDSALVATPKLGSGEVAELRFENTVFAGNHAANGVAPWFAQRVHFIDCLVFEPAIERSWLRLDSPRSEVAIERGWVGLPGRVVDFLSSPEVPQSLFKPVQTNGTTLALHKPSPALAVNTQHSIQSVWRKWHGSWSDLIRQALQGQKPDLKPLWMSLRKNEH